MGDGSKACLVSGKCAAGLRSDITANKAQSGRRVLCGKRILQLEVIIYLVETRDREHQSCVNHMLRRKAESHMGRKTSARWPARLLDMSIEGHARLPARPLALEPISERQQEQENKRRSVKERGH